MALLYLIVKDATSRMRHIVLLVEPEFDSKKYKPFKAGGSSFHLEYTVYGMSRYTVVYFIDHHRLLIR
jgi:hypothetical protein